MNNNKCLAPVVLFAYNRVDHLKKTLDSLSLNYLANESELIVFSDGPRDAVDLHGVKQVREFLYDVQHTSGFKSLTIYEAKENKGLARSIIDGVSFVIEEYLKVIVVEDDVLTSRYFLLYMNDALNIYKGNQEIGSIASYVPNIKIPADYPHSVYLSMRPSSIAWGTWIDRWRQTDWDLKGYRYDKFNFILRSKLNSWGNDVAGRLDRYVAGYNNSWAVRFTVSRIKCGQYAVHPLQSLSMHIGYDNSGTNTSAGDLEKFNVSVLSVGKIEVPDVPPEWDHGIRKEYCLKYHRSRLSAAGEFVLVVLFGLKRNNFVLKRFRELSGLIKRIHE